MRGRNEHFKEPVNPAVMALWLRATEEPYGIAIPCGSEQDRYTLAYQLKVNRKRAGEAKYDVYKVLLPQGSNEVWIVLRPPEETPEEVEE